MLYSKAAEPLTRIGVLSPTLLSADERLRKIILEYLPHKITQAEVAEDEALSMLSSLHAYPPDHTWTYHLYRWVESTLEHDHDLADDIAVAKAWIVTEVVNLLYARQKSDYQRYLSWYREHLPGWLEKNR